MSTKKKKVELSLEKEKRTCGTCFSYKDGYCKLHFAVVSLDDEGCASWTREDPEKAVGKGRCPKCGSKLKEMRNGAYQDDLNGGPTHWHQYRDTYCPKCWDKACKEERKDW